MNRIAQAGLLAVTFALQACMMPITGTGIIDPGTEDHDADDDGFDSVEHDGDDCDDENPEVNPDATEVCNDLDDDCDGQTDEELDCTDADADDDGYNTGDDCDDSDPDVNPGEAEDCDNGKDDDCDGLVDSDDPECDTGTDDFDADNDGFEGDGGDGSDCDDTDPDVNPDADEVCDNNVDDDCDGDVDEDDSECDMGTPIDEREDLAWIKADNNALGINCELVFSDDADCDAVVITGDNIDEDWGYDEDNLVYYLDSGDDVVDYSDSVDGFGWYDLEDGLYRVTWRDDDNNWALYNTYCETSQDDDPELGASALCWANTPEQGGGWSICLQVEDGEIYQADEDDCEDLS